MTVEDYAAVFKCLSEPVRLRILNLLLEHGELCVCDLVEALNLSQSAVSRHLAYLRHHSLVESRRDAVWIYYRVTPRTPFLNNLFDWLRDTSANSDAFTIDRDKYRQISNRSCS